MPAKPPPSSSQQEEEQYNSKTAEQTLEKEKVINYFNKIKQPINITTDISNPQELANASVNAAMEGDTTHFDNLIADSQKVKEELESISAPPKCYNYHQILIRANNDSIEMLQNLKTAILNKDLQSINNLNKKGEKFKEILQKLKQEEQKIKAFYKIE
ncbi:MAG: hypothetical protein HYU63_09190 [Armatimonadetes bacterium]|nr:hypothetical protein [Armatimonadota bacterium]